jgi:hypothetical protein
VLKRAIMLFLSCERHAYGFWLMQMQWLAWSRPYQLTQSTLELPFTLTPHSSVWSSHNLVTHTLSQAFLSCFFKFALWYRMHNIYMHERPIKRSWLKDRDRFLFDAAKHVSQSLYSTVQPLSTVRRLTHRGP